MMMMMMMHNHFDACAAFDVDEQAEMPDQHRHVILIGDKNHILIMYCDRKSLLLQTDRALALQKFFLPGPVKYSLLYLVC